MGTGGNSLFGLSEKSDICNEILLKIKEAKEELHNDDFYSLLDTIQTVLNEYDVVI